MARVSVYCYRLNVLTDRSFLTRASILFFAALGFAPACGRSDLAVAELGTVGGSAGSGGTGGSGGSGFDAEPDAITAFDSGPPDGRQDVVRSPCGDGVCDDGETCSSCPRDCGLCPGCPDGKCDDGETCASCAPDCGVCPRCGDHVCEPTEDCYSCPEDCGKCSSCGDGICEPTETCASCPEDCGVCAFCGNGKCEPPDETCTNCPQDCGSCSTSVTCSDVITCAFGCLMPFSTTCLSTCVAEGCPNAQAASGAVVDCAIEAFVSQTCTETNLLTCIRSTCSTQIATCLTLGCAEM
jgi:hypothetical protein